MTPERKAEPPSLQLSEQPQMHVKGLSHSLWQFRDTVPVSPTGKAQQGSEGEGPMSLCSAESNREKLGNCCAKGHLRKDMINIFFNELLSIKRIAENESGKGVRS